MQHSTNTFRARTVAYAAAIGAVACLTSQVSSAAPAASKGATVEKTVAAAKTGAATQGAKPAAIRLAAPVAKPAVAIASADVRSKLRFQTVRWGGKPVQTLDEASRILLAKAAAEKAGLQAVGLSYRDVYGVIEAETSWIPRTGSSKNGTPNLGLAQFEPRTARGLGVKDPQDPVQAVFGAAQYMKEGARWAHGKIGHLKLKPEQHAAKVREGVSIYYNLSIKGRNKWNGLNAASLPVETQRHIRNASLGAREAAELARKFDV